MSITQEIPPIEHRVTRLESEMQEVRHTLSELKSSISKIDDNTDKQGREQVRTQVIIEGVQKELTNINSTLNKIIDSLATTSQNVGNRWEKFYSKAFWGILGSLITFIIYFLAHH